MKKSIFILSLLLFVVFITPSIFGRTEAANLKFGTTALTVTTGQTVTVDVIVDAGSDQISSTDAYVLYDPTLLEATTVTAGTFFPTVTNNITSGKVYIAGLVDDPATSKTGSGTLATITFSGLKDGTGTLTFDCSATASNSSKVVKNDINATNVLVCAENGQATVTVGVGGGLTPTSVSGGVTNPTPSVLPQTGIFENIQALAVPGMILLLVGGLLRLAL